MPSSQPVLTIGIPSWNRAEELTQCIQMWAAEIAQVDEDVEIFVSDNGSDDRTPEILRELATQLDFLRYSRNESNIGADRNFLEVFQKASGKYLWLFSDDDYIFEGTLARILDIIRSHNPSYISTNMITCDNTGRIMHTAPKSTVKKDVSNASMVDVLLQRTHWISFISTGIYRADLLDIEDYRLNLSMYPSWIQVYVTAQVLSHAPFGYLTSKCTVKRRVGNGREDCKTFIFDQPEAFARICEKFSVSERVQAKLNRELRRVLPLHHYALSEIRRREASSRIVPGYYRIAARSSLARWLLSLTWRMKRLLSGKGFSLPLDI